MSVLWNVVMSRIYQLPQHTSGRDLKSATCAGFGCVSGMSTGAGLGASLITDLSPDLGVDSGTGLRRDSGTDLNGLDGFVFSGFDDEQNEC